MIVDFTRWTLVVVSLRFHGFVLPADNFLAPMYLDLNPPFWEMGDLDRNTLIPSASFLMIFLHSYFFFFFFFLIQWNQDIHLDVSGNCVHVKIQGFQA